MNETERMAAGLTLTPEQWRAVVAHVGAHWPEEACGLLGGAAGVVRAVYPVENIAHSPTVYQMEPTRQVQAMMEIEDAGWEISGIFHSHPHGPPVPSPSDVAQAYYPDSVYVILSPESGEWRGRAFRIVEGRVTEVGLRVAG